VLFPRPCTPGMVSSGDGEVRQPREIEEPAHTPAPFRDEICLYRTTEEGENEVSKYLLRIDNLLTKLRDELDDIMWSDPKDPRIEAMMSEVREYELKIEKGEIYEPRF